MHFLEDYYGNPCNLHYIRDRDGREIDFATIIDGKLHELIEVKSKDTKTSTSLKYFTDKLQPKHAIQLVGDLTKPFNDGNILITSPIDYFANPPWEIDIK